MTAHSYVFDPATIRTTLFTALTAAVWLWSRVVIEWLVAPALRRAGRGRPAPYDWPRWVYRLRLAFTARRRAAAGPTGTLRVRPATAVRSASTGSGVVRLAASDPTTLGAP